MIDMWSYSGFQFGLVMLGIGIVSGIMLGWGLKTQMLKRHE